MKVRKILLFDDELLLALRSAFADFYSAVDSNDSALIRYALQYAIKSKIPS